MLTILDGSTFVVSDDLGDVGGGAEGVFADDTRMLSRCRLLLDGETPLLLTARATDYFSSTHYLRNAPSPRIPADTVSISRERLVGRTVTEHLVVRSEGMSAIDFDLELELASDFADVISVKAHDFAFGDPETAPTLPGERTCVRAGSSSLTISDADGCRTTVRFSRDAECVELRPRRCHPRRRCIGQWSSRLEGRSLARLSSRHARSETGHGHGSPGAELPEVSA